MCVCVTSVPVREGESTESSRAPENVFRVAVSMPHSVEGNYLWRGFHSPARASPA